MVYSRDCRRNVQPVPLFQILRRMEKLLIHRNLRRLALFLITGCFYLALCIPSIKWMIGHQEIFSRENRKLAPSPKLRFSRASINIFPHRFENYFRDNFGFRNELIDIYNRVVFIVSAWRETNRFRKSGILVGKKGWMFFSHRGQIEDFQRETLFTQEQLQAWKDDLETKKEWLQSKGVKFLFVVAPAKQTIYPEYYPTFIRRIGRESRINQLFEFLAENSNIDFVDLRPPLLRAKNNYLVYFKFNSHWNVKGKQIFAREVIQKVSEWFPCIKEFNVKDFKFRMAPKRRNARWMVSLQGVNFEVVPKLIPSLKRCAKLKKLTGGKYLYRKYRKKTTFHCPGEKIKCLVFSDSFALSIIARTGHPDEENLFLPEFFKKTIYVRHRGARVDLPQLKSLVKEEKPDVVIVEEAERFLKFGPSPSWKELFDSR